MEQQIEQLKDRLRSQEKLASLGLLSAGIAHEVQNPLNFVINFSKMSEKLLKDLSEIVSDNKDRLDAADSEELQDIVDDLQGNLSKIVEHGERAISIIRGILLVSRGKEGEFIPSDVCKIVKEYTWLSYHAMRSRNKQFNVAIHEHYQEGLPLICVIPQDLSRAVLNVVNNALYAIWQKETSLLSLQQEGSAAGDYKPELSVSVAAEGEQLTITIADNGVGMTSEVKQRLYEHFFTTKPVGEGTGLGLGITREIIEQRHSGKISVESTEGQGTTFTFTIPVRSTTPIRTESGGVS